MTMRLVKEQTAREVNQNLPAPLARLSSSDLEHESCAELNTTRLVDIAVAA
jgi:hypothetical protein